MTQQNSFLGTEEPSLVTPTSDDKTMAILAHILTLVGRIYCAFDYLSCKKGQLGLRYRSCQGIFELSAYNADCFLYQRPSMGYSYWNPYYMAPGSNGTRFGYNSHHQSK